MKAVVTGGAGFIGSHIADRLLEMGAKVIIIDDLSSGKAENIPSGAKFIEEDICGSYFKSIFSRADAVFHNAASKKNICLKNPQRDLEVNGGGTLRMLQLSKRYNVKKFVHASTGSVYGNVEGRISERTLTNPVSYYGISKLAGENYVKYFNQAYGRDTTILRYFHVYGSRQADDPDRGGVVAIFKKQIKRGKEITIHGTGEQQRVFTRVEDIVEANIRALEPGMCGEIYNCASNKQVTVNELAEILGATKIKHGDALEGDIFSFSVSSAKIRKLGVKFKGFC